MKRKLAMTLLGVALVLTGCGNSQKSETEPATTAETSTEASSAESTEAASEAATEGSSETAAETETEVPAEEPEYNALDYVTLGDYKGLEVTLLKVEVTDEEVEAQITSNIKNSDKMDTLTEGTVQEGDIAVIDFEGKLDGEAFDGGTSKNYELEIGSGSFIDGFEDGLIGVEVGKTVDLNLTFPENYSSTDLAGQDVVFTVTVNEIQRMPELTDELVTELSDCETVAEYQDYVRESLLSQKKSNQPTQKLNDLYYQIYTGSTINSYPEDVVAYRTNQLKSYYQSMAEQYELEFADFLEQYMQITEEQFDTQSKAIIQSSMVQELLMNAIAETEKLEVDDTYFDENIESYVAQTGAESKEALLSVYGEEELRKTMRMDMAMNFVVANCKVTNPEDEVETEAETEPVTEEAASEEETTEAAATEEATESETAAETETAAESESEGETIESFTESETNQE
ncbi:MAG: trigger factor [Eubacteriales bacterium]|nr:trigger factor [Eubacteriales bacterium]